MDVNGLIEGLGTEIKAQLRDPVDVETIDEWPNHIYSEKRKWLRVKDVVVVAADLKSSTKLGFNKNVNTSASIYEAAMTSSVKVLTPFDPRFVDIQGDGLFAIFHGVRAIERAFCAAVTLKTLSVRELGPQLTAATDGNVETGLKVGMDRGVLAVKKVGVRGTNEEVWAGKPVNWAFKCAQSADRNGLIVTSRVWSKLSINDYITHACDCSALPGGVWKYGYVDSLPRSEQGECRRLTADGWCATCGNGFVAHILDGDKHRPKVRFHPTTHQRRAG